MDVLTGVQTWRLTDRQHQDNNISAFEDDNKVLVLSNRVCKNVVAS